VAFALLRPVMESACEMGMGASRDDGASRQARDNIVGDDRKAMVVSLAELITVERKLAVANAARAEDGRGVNSAGGEAGDAVSAGGLSAVLLPMNATEFAPRLERMAAKAAAELETINNIEGVQDFLERAVPQPRTLGQMKNHFRAGHIQEFVKQDEARGRPGRGEQIKEGKRFVPGVLKGGPPASLADFIAGLDSVLPPAAAGAADVRLAACGALLSGVATVGARGQRHEVPFEIAHSLGATLANIVRATATIEGGRGAQELRVGDAAGFTVTFAEAGSQESTLAEELHDEITKVMRARASNAVRALRAGEADGALRIARDASLARVAGSRDLHRATTNDVFLLWISCLALAAKAVTAQTQLGAGEEEEGGEEVGGGGAGSVMGTRGDS